MQNLMKMTAIRRKPCPKCKTVRLKRFYDRLSPLEGGAWRAIGSYCPKCHYTEFLVNGKLMTLDEERETVIMQPRDFLREIWANIRKYKNTKYSEELRKFKEDYGVLSDKVASARDKGLDDSSATKERNQLILRYMKYKENLPT